MSNNYVPDESDLLPGELARSADINLRYSNVVAGFDLLPTPLGSGQTGFSAALNVGTPTANTHAVTKLFAETTIVTAAEAAALVYIQPTLAAHLAATTVLRDEAAASATASANSATASQTSRLASETAETNAETAETNAETAEASSIVAKNASQTSASASAASAAASATSATEALASKNAAATSATDSAASAVTSNTAKTSALAAQAAAETAETNAEAAEANVVASATAAAASAASALTSKNSATASATSATSSASSASGSSGTATTKASESAASASAALASQNSASGSATTATNQAAIATTKAGESSSSAAAASTSETNASTSASNAATSETNAGNSETAAASSASAAAASFDQFDDIYLGAKSSAPTVDNDGNALATGALYFNTVSNTMFVYAGSSWAAAGSAVNGTAERQEYVATSGQTNFSATYDVGFVDVYLNGSKLIPTTDFTATNGATVILTTGAVTGDNVSIIAYGAFNVADVYTQAQSDARYAQIANVYNKTDSDARYTQQSNNLSDLDNAATALTNLGLTATATELNYTDGVTSNIQTQIDNIDALPSQTGNTGNYLTTNGTDASWAEVSASPTLEATASGALANGDLVAINTDGTVSVVAETAQSFGTSVEFTSNQLEYLDIVYDANANKVVIAYRDLSVGNYGYAIVGTVSGSTISFGTAVTFSTSKSAAWISLAYSSAENKIVVCYQVPNSSNHGKAKVGTISGTSISFGSEATFRADEVGYVTSIYHPVEDKIVIGYRDGALSDKGYLVAGTISGATITFGTAYVFWGAHAQNISLTYDSVQDKILVAYSNVSNSYYGQAVVGDLNGTAFTFGTTIVFRSGDTREIDSVYDSINGKHIIAYRSASESNRGRCNIATVSGTAVSFPSTQEEFSTSTYADQINVTFDEDTGLIGFVFRHGGVTNRYVTATYVAGDTLSFSSEANWGSENGVWLRTANIGSSTFVSAYRDNRNTPTANNDGYATVFNNTSSNAAKYIGISDAAYSDAATATVQIVGSVDDAQSGLSSGTKYYVTETGTLSTTANNNYAGIAVSPTKLIVKG